MSLPSRQTLLRLVAAPVLLAAFLAQAAPAFTCDGMGDERPPGMECCLGLTEGQGCASDVSADSQTVDAARVCCSGASERPATLTERDGRRAAVALLLAAQPPPLLPWSELLPSGRGTPAVPSIASSAAADGARTYLLTRRLRL